MNMFSPEAFGALWQSAWVQGVVAFVVWILAFTTLQYVLTQAIRRLAARTGRTWDRVLIAALRWPWFITIFAGGLVLTERILPLGPEWDRASDVMLAAAVVLAIVLFADRVTSGLLDRLSQSQGVLHGARGLVQGTVRGLVIGIGLLIFLDSIGISIAPILASLGVGSLAVALALQETLANLFAGFHLIADKPIEAVTPSACRAARRAMSCASAGAAPGSTTLQRNTVVVPNAKLAGAVLTNFDLPTSETVFIVELTVGMSSDPDEVERITLATAREALATVPGATRAFDPLARFVGHGESGLRLNLVVCADSLRDSHVVRHEVVKRVTAAYRRAGIVIPYPTRTIDAPPGLFGGETRS